MARGDFGFNASISGRTAGSRKVRVMNLEFGLEIIASADSEARSRRAFYPVVTDGSSFSLVLGFVSWEEREAFTRWMRRFMVSVSEGSAKYGTLTVRCPTRNFTRVGVPQGTLEYGEGVLDVAYTLTLTFVGATDPVDITLSNKMAGVSYFKGPADKAQSQFFYPLGKQISGAESLEGTLFDTHTAGSEFTVTPEEVLDHHFLDEPGV